LNAQKKRCGYRSGRGHGRGGLKGVALFWWALFGPAFGALF